MQPIVTGNGLPRLAAGGRNGGGATTSRVPLERLGAVAGTTTDPQEIFGDETLEQALRQLTLHGRSGLPVLSDDREHLSGWITRGDVLRALADSIGQARQATEAGAVAADFGADDPEQAAHRSSAPLHGYEIVELSITPGSAAAGRRVSDVAWPDGSIVVAVTDHGELVTPRPDAELRAGERVVVLTPVPDGVHPK